MKRVLGIAFALLTIGFTVPAEAKTAEISPENATVTANSAPQYQRYRYDRRGYDRRSDRRYDRWGSRTVRRSRIVRYGRRLYRETYAIRYYPNGRTDTWLISRTRIG